MAANENLPAYCFYQVFEPAEPVQIQFDRHYLMYAAKGAIRLEVEEIWWSLPPSRAAWIAAGTSITVVINQPLTCCSVLFKPDFIAPPAETCRVFSLSNIARDMIWHARRWGPELDMLDAHAQHFFSALAFTCAELAVAPTENWIPRGRSDPVRRAIAFTGDNLGQQIDFSAVADAARLSRRALARRFANETGMTWGQILRRMRMIRAVELIANPNSQVLDVAMEVGYLSPSAFAKTFREFTGETPARFRSLCG
jgi:AraC-like DNA-binding protein